MVVVAAVGAVGGSTAAVTAAEPDGATISVWGDDRYSQGRAPEAVTPAVAMAAGAYHSLVLRDDGTVVAWGRNLEGQATVPDGLSGVTAIAAGALHSLALRNDGTVIAGGPTSTGRRWSRMGSVV